MFHTYDMSEEADVALTTEIATVFNFISLFKKKTGHLSQAAYASLRAADDTREKPFLRRITVCPKNDLTTGDTRSA